MTSRHCNSQTSGITSFVTTLQYITCILVMTMNVNEGIMNVNNSIRILECTRQMLSFCLGLSVCRQHYFELIDKLLKKFRKRGPLHKKQTIIFWGRGTETRSPDTNIKLHTTHYGQSYSCYTFKT